MAQTAEATTSDSAPTEPVKGIAVLNNEQRLHAIQLPASKPANAKTLTPGEILRLLPGWNFVAAVEWKAARKNPQVNKLLEAVIQPSAAPEANQERTGHKILVEGPELADVSNPLKGLGVDKAREMIPDVLAVPVLERLLVQESREIVASLLRERLAGIRKHTRAKPIQPGTV